MATFLSKAATDPQSADEGVDIASRGRELQTLVDKYTESFPTRLALNGSARPLPPGDIYLLTGTTGGLGSNMLGHLLETPTVVRIYAFNRPSKSATSEARQLSAFRQRGLNTNLLSNEKLVYIEGDLSKPAFGLGDKQYGEVSEVAYVSGYMIILIRRGYVATDS
jgi:Male sterility protein